MANHDRSKEAFWRRMIRRQAGSGLSVRAWCGRHDVSEASFYWWRRRLGPSRNVARKSGPRKTVRPRFVPVRVAVDTASVPNGGVNCIEIILSGNQRVRVLGAVDRRVLADVLAVLHVGGADANNVIDAEAAAC